MHRESRGVWPPVSLHGGHTIAGDDAGRPAEMVAAAAQAGMEVFGLSEHFYRPRHPRYRYDHESAGSDWGRSGWPWFVDEVQAAAEVARAERRLEVLLGAEVEYLPGQLEWTLEELARWPLDYTVLSVHFLELDGQVLPFDISPQHWREAAARCGGPIELYRRYYEQVLEALSWPIGDVLGHLDVIKIHAPGQVEDSLVEELIDRVIARCAARGMVLDLNARGLVKPCAEVYPGASILARARAAGVRIITGDDSHRPADVGQNLDRAAAWAREAGYEAVHLPARLGTRAWHLERGSAVGTASGDPEHCGQW